MRRVEGVTPRVSFADLQRMPEDGNRYELYDGEPRVVPSPLPIHQVVAQRLFLAVNEFARHHSGAVFMAPFDIVLSDYNVVEPDLIYFGSEAARRIRLREHVRFPPDLAIEVLSPSTASIDRGPKRDLLARFGLPEYWVVDPEIRHVEISGLRGRRYGPPRIVNSGRCKSPRLPGLALDTAQLFAGLDE